MTRAPRARVAAAVLAAALTATGALAGCGAGGGGDQDGGRPTLTWFINPDGGGGRKNGGGQAQIAVECSTDRYDIEVQQLPNSASDQRIQLLRRLAAGDSGVDLMSIDPVFVPEFAEAGYLAPVPEDKQKEFTQDRVDSAIESSRWKDEMVTVPFWANTQVLWYRKDVAKKAGLDMTTPVTWDEVIEAAQKTGTTVGVQASLYEGYVVWINALVSGAGGKIVENPGADADTVQLGLDSDEGRKAAAIIRKVSDTGVGGPAMGSSQETESLALFQGRSGGFLVNWPYTFAAVAGDKKLVKNLGWARYPQTVQGKESAPPFGGIQLGVGANSAHPDLAYEAAGCITNQEHQTLYMLKTGNPASRKKVYDDPKVKAGFPMAGLIRTSLDAAAPRPQTQYYGDVSTAIQQRFSPPDKVTADSPAQTQTFIKDVMKGEALL